MHSAHYEVKDSGKLAVRRDPAKLAINIGLLTRHTLGEFDAWKGA